MKTINFIHVGANDGITRDPIIGLIKKGGRGILIEPLTHYYNQLTSNLKDYDGLIFEKVAIAPDESEKEMFYVNPDWIKENNSLPDWIGLLGSFSKKNITKHINEKSDSGVSIISSEKVKCVPLSKIIDKYDISSLSLLSVDAEGYDDKVLMSLDFSKCSPEHIWFEYKHLSKTRFEKLERFLSKNGYEFVVKDNETIKAMKKHLIEENDKNDSLPPERYIKPKKQLIRDKQVENKSIIKPTNQIIIASKPEYVVLIVSGGIGKNINATVPIRGIRKKYPDQKIVVLSAWPDIYKYNPNVYQTFRIGTTPNFYDNYIQGKKSIVLNTEPYYHTDYINKSGRHITELWCEQLQVPFDNIFPELYFGMSEIEGAVKFKNLSEKPLLFIQGIGGNTIGIKQFVRSLPMQTIVSVIQEMQKTHRIVLIKTKEQPDIEGIESTNNYSLRDSISLLTQADKVFCIDSMIQHVCAAMKKKAVVCWCSTNPELLGYPTNQNIRMQVCPDPECHRPNSYLSDQNASLTSWSCPYGDLCINHDANSIIEALKCD